MLNEQIDNFQQKAPELLSDLAKRIELGVLSKMSSANDENQQQARQIGIEIAHDIANAWGGEVIYIPRNLILLLSERDRQIYAEFNGRNHSELARKYKVSMQWVYQIVKKMRKEEIDRQQPQLF